MCIQYQVIIIAIKKLHNELIITCYAYEGIGMAHKIPSSKTNINFIIQ